MVRISMAFDDSVKERKKAVGMTWERIFMLGLANAEDSLATKNIALVDTVNVSRVPGGVK
jgi:hypothetical protein